MDIMCSETSFWLAHRRGQCQEHVRNGTSHLGEKEHYYVLHPGLRMACHLPWHDEYVLLQYTCTYTP